MLSLLNALICLGGLGLSAGFRRSGIPKFGRAVATAAAGTLTAYLMAWWALWVACAAATVSLGVLGLRQLQRARR